MKFSFISLTFIISVAFQVCHAQNYSRLDSLLGNPEIDKIVEGIVVDDNDPYPHGRVINVSSEVECDHLFVKILNQYVRPDSSKSILEYWNTFSFMHEIGDGIHKPTINAMAHLRYDLLTELVGKRQLKEGDRFFFFMRNGEHIFQTDFQSISPGVVEYNNIAHNKIRKFAKKNKWIALERELAFELKKSPNSIIYITRLVDPINNKPYLVSEKTYRVAGPCSGTGPNSQFGSCNRASELSAELTSYYDLKHNMIAKTKKEYFVVQQKESDVRSYEYLVKMDSTNFQENTTTTSIEKYYPKTEYLDVMRKEFKQIYNWMTPGNLSTELTRTYKLWEMSRKEKKIYWEPYER